ncbi:amidohydrolase family protein [Alteromonas sp. C1M14]|uniref:N-acyl-D-amino-acid deacylase family protein n=1 Tax=Alteromonas sp. C1M14 TaxID=2841567 RepID=UPI001C086F74|nr:amidohydrolase family protein [Alteromonas sp. C1M14]MBU2977306.1 amidohydrolase family protein [Alteromonas sp. C1M14]
MKLNSTMLRGLSLSISCALLLSSCAQPQQQIDTLITGKHIFRGGDFAPTEGVIGIKDGKIVFVEQTLPDNVNAKQTIDAGNAYVAPGFIDPHTHACADFTFDSPNPNNNYLTQGVTTVFCNVDGGGETQITPMLDGFEQAGLGTNVAVYIGHGAVRRAVMGVEDRAPTAEELTQMQNLVSQAMDEGALGLSTGLYYVPGNFADLDEVVALASVAARKGGVYDSHLRDESSYSIGLAGAVQEAIDVGINADIPVHIAHIKALGVDVWGESTAIIKQIENAQRQGVKVTADQYPWRASGTSVAGALVPRKVLAGSAEQYHARLQDPQQWPTIKTQMADNLRRRGGADSLLISDPKRPDIRGKTLQEVADLWQMSPVDAARKIILAGNARVASFNMTQEDIDTFMQQEWVMTSSDGSTGHPRKYATFPKKFHDYVAKRSVISAQEFVARSSTLPATFFGLTNYGKLAEGYNADIVIFDPQTYLPKADYLNPTEVSTGVEWLWLNGKAAIANGELTGVLPGKALRKTVPKSNG